MGAPLSDSAGSRFELPASFGISVVVHLLFLFGLVLTTHAWRQTPMLQLREIEFIEPMEVLPPPEPEVVKKSMFSIMKEVIPIKQRRVRPVVKRSAPAAAPPAAPKPREVYSAAPLIAKNAVLSQAAGASPAEPIISKKSIGAGPGLGSPQWEKGPGNRTGGGGSRVNLGLSTVLPEARQRTVADADIAASLHGRRGGLSLHTSTDVKGIVANVGQGKSMRLAAGHAGNNANLGGFRDAFAVFGDIKNRKILRMKMPKYPVWAEEQGIEAATTIRVGVLADGSVDETSIYVESTSGYPELDNLAIQAVKQFFFAPLPSAKSQVVQYGSVRFAFQLKR